MTKRDKEEFLVDRGWSQWYNDDYWVHKKMVKDHASQDYTNYGLSLEEAYNYEKDSLQFV